MSTKTFKELQEIDKMVGGLYAADPELKNTKFGYAYKRFAEKNYHPTLNEYREDIGLAIIDNALEDEKTKALITDNENPRGYKFTKDGLKACIKAENKLQKEYEVKEVEVTPYFCTSLPILNDEQHNLLIGTLIEDTADENSNTKTPGAVSEDNGI